MRGHSLAILVVAFVAVASDLAIAEPFLGPSALSRTAVVIIEGGDPAIGTPNDRMAAEKIAKETLRAPVIRVFQPTKYTLNDIAAEFDTAGALAKELMVAKPEAILFLITGHGSQAGFAYGTQTLFPSSLGQYIAKALDAAPGAGVLAIMDSCYAGAQSNLLDELKTHREPVQIIMGALSGQKTGTIQRPQLLQTLSNLEAPFKFDDLLPRSPGSNDTIGLLTSLALLAFQGAANGDNRGYSISDITAWITDIYPRILQKLDHAQTTYGTLVIESNLGSAAKDRFAGVILKRRHFRVGLCLYPSALLPGQTASDTYKKLHDQATLFTSELDKQLPTGSLLPEIFSPTPSSGNTGVELCDTNSDRFNYNLYDLWVTFVHEGNNRYQAHIFEPRLRREHHAFVNGGLLEPDLEAALTERAQWLTGRALLGVSDHITSQSVNIKPAILFIIDNSRSNEFNDPEARNRRAIIESIVSRAKSLNSDISIQYIVFGDNARSLNVSNSIKINELRELLAKTITDEESTNLQAALQEAGKLITAGTYEWHVILLSDGVPERGETDWKKLKSIAQSALGGSAVLHVFALQSHEGKARRANRAPALRDLVHVIAPTRGQAVDVYVEDPKEKWAPRATDIVAEITSRTKKAAATIECKPQEGMVSCHGDLSLPPLRDPTFMIDSGTDAPLKWTITIENTSLDPMMIKLDAAPSVTVNGPNGVRAKLTRLGRLLSLDIWSPQTLKSGWNLNATGK